VREAAPSLARASRAAPRRCTARAATPRRLASPAQAGRPPSQLSTGHTAAEPTFGVAEDGTIFYVGIEFPTLQTPRSIPLRSRDSWKTWQEMDVIVQGTREGNRTLDPFMYLDKRTGRLFNLDLTPPC
jgi:hypothetical protein